MVREPRYIMVTGAGTGIGQAVSSELAGRGYGVLLLGRRGELLEESRDGLANPETHRCLSCDVRDGPSIGQALAASGVEELYGVVANAGVCSPNFHSGGH